MEDFTAAAKEHVDNAPFCSVMKQSYMAENCVSMYNKVDTSSVGNGKVT